MTEPENFDDELFADLYNDDDTAVKPAPIDEPDHYSAGPSAADTKHEQAEDAGNHQDHNGGDGNVKYDEEEDDDDDDIDFNLGNGPSTAITHHDSQDHNDQYDQQDEKPSFSAPPALAAPSKGPNAKEDG